MARDAAQLMEANDDLDQACKMYEKAAYLFEMDN